MAREPGYCRHKPTNQAYVNLGGKVIYLGEYGSEKSKERYRALKAEWLLNRHSTKFSKETAGQCMAELCLAYLDHARSYYPKGNEYSNVAMAAKPISELYPTLPTAKFTPVEFTVVREWWLNRDTKRGGKCTRKTINDQMFRLLRILKWGVAQGMFPVVAYQTLKCVEPLKFGRTSAVESVPIKPVSAELVRATLPHLTQVLADMVRFHQLVGCRPGEVVKITPAMVDRSSDVWTITLGEHKTAYRGKSRTIYVGPKAQAILAPYLLRADDAHCFSPVESENQRRTAAHEARRTPISCGNRPGTNKIARKPRRAPGASYTTGTYARAIMYACKRAKLVHWHPNQLRHSAATLIRKEFGLEAAQVILGHSAADVTQIYAEKDAAKAVEVARKIG